VRTSSKIGATIHEKMKLVASAFEKRSASELENLTIQELEIIMGENSLGFPQGKF
jgi:hypothetical protein